MLIEKDMTIKGVDLKKGEVIFFHTFAFNNDNSDRWHDELSEAVKSFKYLFKEGYDELRVDIVIYSSEENFKNTMDEPEEYNLLRYNRKNEVA